MDLSLDNSKTSPDNQQQGNTIMTKLVCFNMAGKVFKVSHTSLFETHPNSCIAQIASEQLQLLQQESIPDHDIVLEWDGDRLRFVMLYLQGEGYITLPRALLKTASVDNHAYFGVLNIDESKIIRKSIRSAMKYFWQLKATIRAEIKSWDVSSTMALLAHECVTLSLKSNDNLDVTIYGPGSNLPLPDKSSMCSDETFTKIWALLCNNEKILLQHDKEECNQYLCKVGLEVISAVALSEKCIIQVVMKMTDI